MAKTEVQIVVKGKDEASGVMRNIATAAGKLGVGIGAAGAAGMAMVASSKGVNAQLSVTAHNLQVSTEEMRELTLATTNETFPIEEVTASFDLLSRAGVKDMKVMSDVATAFDTLGDATGQSASKVTDVLVPTMKTFRLSAEEMAGKTDLLAYMVRNSTTSLADFNTMVGYTRQDMVDAGLTVEDMAAAMMYMADNGVAPGRVMLTAWNNAVKTAEKEEISLTEALGMGSDELETYKGKLKDTKGLTQELADLQNEQYTITDKLKQKWGELTLKASAFLEPLEPMLAGMTALGPLMIALTSSAGMGAIKWTLHTGALIASKIAMFASAIAIKAVAAAQWILNAAMAANPIGLVIIAVAGLIAIAVLLIKNWDAVVGFFENAWEKLKDGFEKVKDFFAGVWEGIVKIFREHWDKILAVLFPGVGFIALIARNWDGIVDFFKGICESIAGFFENAWDTIKDGFFSGVNFVIDQLNGLIRLINIIPGITIDEIGHVGASPRPGGRQHLAAGGIVTGPTQALIGEAGPEAVIPLRGGGFGSTVNVVVEGSIWALDDLTDRLRTEFLKIKADNTTTGF